jgi:uncharacterized protein
MTESTARPLEFRGKSRNAETSWGLARTLSDHCNSLHLNMLNNDILSVLRCPENRSPLSLANDETLRRANAAIRDGRLVNCAGQVLDRPLEGGLVREDGALLYPIIDGIPVLLRDDAILLEQLVD